MENYVRDIILKPFDFSLMKVERAVFIAAPTFITISTITQDYLGISGTFILVLFVLLIADFLTGVTAAKTQKKRITSRRGLRTLYKAGAYVLFIYVSFNLQQELQGKAELFETIIKYFHIYILVHISFWELFSIDENMKKLGIELGITGLLKNSYAGVRNIFSRIGKPEQDYNHEEDYNEEEFQ